MSIASAGLERSASLHRSSPLGSLDAKAAVPERPTFESSELLQGRSEALIEHRGEMYRLRLTGSGKLYLTK
jgi:hemin uptake protein HemP